MGIVREPVETETRTMHGPLPSGTVTFLFTDVEGSTRLLHSLGAEAYAEALAEHRGAIRAACAAEGGVEVDTQGDAFFFAFPTAAGALTAATAFSAALASGPIQVRAGIHTGSPLLTAEGYVGSDVHRAARIAAAGHGGQVLVSAATASLVGTDGLHDLGEHRFKDLSAPERVYQVGGTSFPALRTLYRTNLPVPLTPFLGRDRELAELTGLIGRDDTRLVTLTGPGGTGKTRLALAAAGHAADAFPDGVWWIPLAPIRDPALVLATAGRVLGSRNGLAEHIADRRMLCLFDNFEQVVDAAAGIGELLAACPNLEVLVTSRERLRLRGEQAYPVPPLAETDGEALFVERARAADPGFTPDDAVGELCRRLDDLPLAIELAAARTALFTPAQLLERLGQRLDLLKGARDADPRQQTLRATIAWSHDLLSEDERRLFRRLSVFRGGSTYEAAEAIAGAEPETLGSLVDKSLVRRRDAKAGPRFAMLETIREFAAELLETSGEDAEIRLRHATWFLDLAEEGTFVAMDATWLDRVDADIDNVRGALDFGAGTGETQRVLRANAQLRDYWGTRGLLSEGVARVERALAADTTSTVARCLALNAAMSAHSNHGDAALAQRRIEEARTIADELGDPYLRALTATGEAWSLTGSARWAEALAILDDTVPALRELGAWDVALPANRTRAWMHEELGDMNTFWELTEENLRDSRAHGHRRIEARSLGALAERAAAQGRFEEVRDLLEQSLAIDRELGNIPFMNLDLVRFAAIHTREGRPATAARLISRAVAALEEIGFALESWMTIEIDEAIATVRRALEPAAFDAAWDAGRSLGLEEAIALALGETDEPARIP